jgi:hypothetical protein
VDVDKDLVRRVLAKHYHPTPDDDGPSWLTLLGHTKDSLWSIELLWTTEGKRWSLKRKLGSGPCWPRLVHHRRPQGEATLSPNCG